MRWWKEALLIAAVYAGYWAVRNTIGSSSTAPEVAARNADRVIDLERRLGLYFEPDLHLAFVDWTAFIQFWNLFYGAFHFVVTFAVLIWMYRSHPHRYQFWRRAGLIGTSLALVGYALFPLMPPRLLGNCGRYGACRPDSPYTDTVAEIGGLWSFESSAMETISNQYAAMPSLHIGWAFWCAILIARHGEGRATVAAGIMYPFLTLFAIVVTANHYWVDGLGGVVVIGLGQLLSRWWERPTPDLAPNPA